MNIINALFQDLNIFYISNNEKFSITNPLYTQANNSEILTWYNYQTKQYFYTYDEYYAWVVNNLQYSLVIDNKVLIQMYYVQKEKSITQASLSFLPHPDLLMSYFRFDMDTNSCKDYYHNSYHVNFGYRSDDIRFSLNRFPHPSEFLRFVLFLLGHEEFKAFNRKRFFNDLNSLGEQYSHNFDFTLT